MDNIPEQITEVNKCAIAMCYSLRDASARHVGDHTRSKTKKKEKGLSPSKIKMLEGDKNVDNPKIRYIGDMVNRMQNISAWDSR
jgi:hypothetical protein